MSDSRTIGEAIAGAIDHLTRHPEDASYTDSAAIATLKGGLRVSVRDPAGRTVETDMTKGVGGEDTGPSAGWLFRAALASVALTVSVPIERSRTGSRPVKNTSA